MSIYLSDKKSDKLYSAILLCISIFFYAFFALYDGVVIAVDSSSYIDMYISREPFYCVFLALLRTVFNLFGGEGTTLYLTAAVYIQSLLAALAAWCLADYLKKEFELSFIQSTVVLFIPLSVSLLCRFAAGRTSMYSNNILTEGITCSFFLIYIRFLLEFYYKRNIKYVIITCILSFVMISTRKQMYITLILLDIVICWAYLMEKRIRRGILIVAICTCCILSGNVIFDNGYNYLVSGELGRHSGDNRFMATMVIYTSEKSYGENITDENARDLFYQIYDICDEQGYLMHNAEHGWYNRVNHFGNHYDNIQIDTMWPTIQNYVYEEYEDGEVYLEKKVDKISNQIIIGLLPKVWTKVLGCFADNFLSGLITTVSKSNPILIVYSFFVYILYFVLLIMHIKSEGMTKLAFLAIFTILSIIINVAVVSLVIFCQTRYTIYNMPIFYISLWILLIKTYYRFKKHKFN